MAKPKKARKPRTSVAVVMKMVAEVAGSLPSFFMMRGMMAPKKPATMRLKIMAAVMMAPKIGLWPLAMAIIMAIEPVMRPLMAPAPTSLRMAFLALPRAISPRAMPRTMTARVWVAAFPPMPATIGR